MSVCLDVYLCTLCLSGAQDIQREMDFLGLEIHLVMSFHMGAGNPTCILWKSSQFSKLPTQPPALVLNRFKKNEANMKRS